MNESDLEKELRSLLPTKPSPQLSERIAAELNAPIAPTQERATGVLARPSKQRDASRFLRPWVLALSGLSTVVIALLAVAFWLKPGSTSTNIATKPETSAQAFALNENPDESVDELIDAQDEGLVYGEGEEPQRQVRITYLERHTWTNPKTGAVVEVEVPREDIVLMPVAMQ